MEVSKTVADSDYRALCEFLFKEASILDRHQYSDWLNLLDPGIEYRLFNRLVSEFNRKDSDEVGDAVSLLNEHYRNLEFRVAQLVTPNYTVAENPRSKMRRHITNVIAEPGEHEGEFRVFSNCLVFRSRDAGRRGDVFSLGREDVIRKVEGRLLLVSRSAELDEAIVSARGLSTLF